MSRPQERDLRVDLVGGEFEERFANANLSSEVGEPSQEGSLIDHLTDLWHYDSVLRHASSPRLGLSLEPNPVSLEGGTRVIFRCGNL